MKKVSLTSHSEKRCFEEGQHNRQDSSFVDDSSEDSSLASDDESESDERPNIMPDGSEEFVEFDEGFAEVEKSFVDMASAPGAGKNKEVTPFGEWEKYTSGFGSRMLAKMGYKKGGPLGSENRDPILGPARLYPVPIRVIPPRMSLDFIGQKEGRLPKKRGKRGSGKRKRQRGEDGILEEVKEPREAECFALVTSLSSAAGSTDAVIEKVKKNQKQQQAVEEAKLNKVRRGDHSEKELRTRLVRLEQEQKQLMEQMEEVTGHVERHTSNINMSPNSGLRETYSSAHSAHEQHLQRIATEKNAINSRLEREHK
eukprot:Filipodium_phascolosomae@DN1490_c0_g1_i2.p1